MSDIFAVDIFLETLKSLIWSSNLDVNKEEEDQLQSLVEDIKSLRGFLEMAENKRNETIGVLMDLVVQIKNVVSETENIVDLFLVLASKANRSLVEHQDYPPPPPEIDEKEKEIEAIMAKGYLFGSLRSVKREIKALRAEVDHILDQNMYDINGEAVKKLKHHFTGSGGGSSSTGGRNLSKVVEDQVVVGFEKDVVTLVEKILDMEEGGRLQFVSIVGSGGSGKTTLAREVYDNRSVQKNFDIRIWVNVSLDYDETMKIDMLIRILESVSKGKIGEYYNLSEAYLGERLLICLKGRKYIIVMDDIWDLKAWNDIQRSFPRESNGSTVLFTSRQLVLLPDYFSYSIVHNMARLTEYNSWELLQKKVFRKNQQCRPELVEIGIKIAKKCKGLPLAIIAIAGILATEEPRVDIWEEVAENLISTIAKEQDGCMEILELSYKHLPLHLKACFLYIGAHPENYELPVRELIWLWIAEGFIRQSVGGKSMEDIAEDYLIDLIDRNLVMVARKNDSHGRIKACRIHELLRQLCLKEAKEDNFFVKIYQDDPYSTPDAHKHRRLFIGRQFFQKIYTRPYARNLRSFMCLSLPNSSRFEENLAFFVETFELLRVLNLISATSLGEIRVGDFVHLRYLALRLPKGKLYRAPISFHYLSNLETLNLQVSNWRKISLPRHVVKMIKLRHLYTKGGIFDFHDHESNHGYKGESLDSLQTLHRMCICEQCLRFLDMTPNLRKLGLRGDNVPMLPNLEFLEYLETLYVHGWVRWDPRTRVTLTSTGLKPPPTLTGLKPPPTLTQLTLDYTYLEWEELSIMLKNLPKLEVLKLLLNACIGRVWDTSELEEEYSQLKCLKFQGLDIEGRASEDQFRRLEVLVIQECEKLNGIPSDFCYLNELREIKVEWSSRSVEESAKKIQEEQVNMKGDDDCINLIITREDDD